ALTFYGFDLLCAIAVLLFTSHGLWQAPEPFARRMPALNVPCIRSYFLFSATRQYGCCPFSWLPVSSL
ncbi:MAG: hypothetical protein M9901_07290, partial [Lentimicrobium sp.]|nr:hypothetical protein [Lentimicrobium sp.]